jgi:FKBP-type peptidyl-prolyl cis-trans isomerase SlyD
MGCCQNKPEQTEQKAGGCCGGGGHGHDHQSHGHDHGAMKSEGKSCCKGSAISGFFKKLFGGKKSGCCN